MQVIYSRNLAYYVTGLTAKSWCPTNRVKAPKAIILIYFNTKRTQNIKSSNTEVKYVLKHNVLTEHH